VTLLVQHSVGFDLCSWGHTTALLVRHCTEHHST